MNQASQPPVERARKFLALALQRLAGRQEAVGMALGVHESTISRWKGDQLEQSLLLLAALGLKVVPSEMKCYRPQDIDPYIQLARQHMAQINSAEQLSWEEDPE